MIDDDAQTIHGRARYQIDPYTSVSDLLASIDDEVLNATAPQPERYLVGDKEERFWWPSGGLVTVYVTGLAGGKYNPIAWVRRSTVAYQIRRHLDRVSGGYVKLPVLKVSINQTTVVPSLGETIVCDEVVIVLDRSRITEMQPLPE